MQKAVISIGDKIEMTHVKSATRRKLFEYTYGSKLLDYDGFRKAKIAMPIYEGRIIPLEVGDEYELCFFTAAGLYQNHAVVARRFREGKMFVLEMQFLTKPKKFQRRQFYRLDCMMDIQYRLVSQEEKTLRDFLIVSHFEDNAQREALEEKLDEFKREWKSAVMTDVSGGGVRFQCHESVERDTLIEVAFPLWIKDERIPFKSMAKVVATVDINTAASEKELRCAFENISKDNRELLIKYIFEEQKRRLRKE